MVKSSPTATESAQQSPATLGDVLYANCKAPVPELEWETLVRGIAAGDQLALHALYERTHRIVFTLMMRITANREAAEELTIDVFHDILAARVALRPSEWNSARLDYESGALTGDRSPALR